MEATNDSAVFRALSPPVETRRAVRKDVSKVLGPNCAVPKLKALKNVTVPEGQKTILKCELLAGGKQTKIEWYLNGKKIGINPTRQIKMKRKRRTISELTLMKATESDVGKYTCKAVNDQGEDSWDAIVTVTKAATSTTPSAKTSSHVTPCSEEERAYCVNGGECFTLEVTPNSIKRLCRCPNDFTGDRCQTYVTPSFYKAEELYQKRVLTITGICIALLVVGIMCVVAYCKTKKQRKKLHDRLRQSLRERSAMASMANGPLYPQNSHPPPENLQLVNQYALKNALPAQHVIEKETETSFSISQYTSSTQPSTAVTHTSSQCWSNGKMDSVVSDSNAVLVMSRVQNSRNGTPTQRGRLNATGGAREVGPYLKNSRETVDSYKDSPYSERYVSTMTTPTRLSPVKLLSPATPSSPPSEMSAPLSSLATSVPSMATSPSGEEERPLLFLTPPRLREKAEQEPKRSQQLRNSAHYNHGLESPSPPPSPLHITEDDQYESTQECNSTPAAAPASDSQSPAASHGSKRTKPAAQASQPEQEPASGGSSEGNSLESETEDERVGEDTPFLSIQNPGATSTVPLSLDGSDSSRTNPALRLSPQDDLQTRLASVMANQNPIAV
ncbi:pro-neuregulin-1, membrane-bound isoform isoform X5 [Colossoma macropomum]|uniref:pro-neuregulin-1, membrane-bound isoform isoform X5 n=1 Tax=Colossoma macropomum TaxID=42526 RepID=UPI001863C94A|nr:pro-neuregulin-1, membrane-bound isoform isoform X5 [Colossoma macropomum]